MPFNNDIAGGNGSLVRNWIQSVNYVGGVSGWRISKDGSAEFNNGTFRGSIEVGSLTGQHFWVNNPNTGDIIDAYDASNRLLMSLDKNGILTTQDQPQQDSTQITGPNIQFANLATPPFAAASISALISPTSAVMQFVSGATTNTDSFAEMQLQSASSVGGPGGPAIVGFQRIATGGGTVLGSIVQSDQINVNNLIHAASYSGTISVNGVFTFAHNCRFTPVGVVMTSWDIAGVQTAQYPVIGSTPISGANCNTQWWNGNGVKVANGTTIAVFAIFFG